MLALVILELLDVEDLLVDLVDAPTDRREVALLQARLLLDLLLAFGVVDLLAFLALLAIPVEITCELDLRFDLTVSLHEHGVGELHADGVLTALVGVVLVLVVGPDDTAIELLLVRVIDGQSDSINLLLQILLVVVNNFAIQYVDYHFKCLKKHRVNIS